MSSQRATQQALRRLAAARPATFAQVGLRRSMAPATFVSAMQTRPVATERLTPADSDQIIISQRLKRPVAPHLSIYKPQVPWILSLMHRVTGGVLSTGFYAFGAAYLISPLFGLHMDSASIAALFGSFPVILKVATKFLMAMPFTFHSFNGIRHLVWDTGREITNKAVIRSGWTVVGASTVLALGLAVFY